MNLPKIVGEENQSGENMKWDSGTGEAIYSVHRKIFRLTLINFTVVRAASL